MALTVQMTCFLIPDRSAHNLEHQGCLEIEFLLTRAVESDGVEMTEGMGRPVLLGKSTSSVTPVLVVDPPTLPPPAVI